MMDKQRVHSAKTWDRERYPNFSHAEMVCKHTGLCYINLEFMDDLQELRILWGRPLIVVSGFRHWKHPRELRKEKPGTHWHCIGADLFMERRDLWNFMDLLMNKKWFRGIGINEQRNSIHIDKGHLLPDLYRPLIWTYAPKEDKND
jgi:hypothetical protein